MPTKIFVGNLSDDSKSDDLQALFEKFGQVIECDILRNFGFVHMKDESEAKAAIEALNGYNFDGMKMNVEISHSKPRGGRGGGGSGGGPMRRGGSFRGGSRGRGGDRGHGLGRPDPYDRPPRDRYDPYDRYPPPPADLLDLLERRLPLPPLPFERRLPFPRDYRGRDPYARPPPEFYRRDPERYYERLYDLQRRYEQELFDIYYGIEGPETRDRPDVGTRQFPPVTDNQGADSFSRGSAGSAFNNQGPGQGSFSQGYSQDFTSDSFLDETPAPSGPSDHFNNARPGQKGGSSMFPSMHNSHGPSNESGGFRQMNSGNVGQDFYDPFDGNQASGNRLYNTYNS